MFPVAAIALRRSAEGSPDKALKHSRSHREMNVPHIDPAVVLIRLEHFLRVHKNCATAG
jgi:hypothetical protein